MTQTYALKGGDEARGRLERMSEIRAEYTRALFARAGVFRGARCVDLGCGTGHVTRLLADMVGPDGFVLGLDIDDRMIEVNSIDAPGNVEFRGGDIGQFDGSNFDVAYMGLVLMHFPDPREIVDAAVRCLRPGGILITEDVDTTVAFCSPSSPAFDRMIGLYDSLLDGKARRAPLASPELLRAAGLTDVGLSLYQNVTAAAAEKALLPLSLRHAAEAVVAFGLASAEELEDLVAQLEALCEDPACIFAMPRFHQVWGRLQTPAA